MNDYDPKRPTYNLYGQKMCEYLSYAGFEWVKVLMNSIYGKIKK